MGSPAMDFRQWQKSSIYYKRLPDMAAQIAALQKEVEALKAQLAER